MRTLNLGILAHVDAGKTSLTERLLFAAGVIDEIGSVDDGSTQTDTLALERQRGITIKSAVVSFPLAGIGVNLVDTPGHPDFIAEVERVLGVLDGAVLVVSAVEGVQPQTRVLMRALRRLGIPALLFVNKIDRGGAEPGRVLSELRAKLTPAVVPMGIVRGAGSRAAAVTPWPGGLGDGDPARLAELVDVLAGADDALLRAFVADEASVSAGRLARALARQSRRGLVHPVFFGSAITGAGVAELSAGISRLLPLARGDASGPVSGTVFKVERGPAGEKIAYARLFSGTLRVRDRLPGPDVAGPARAARVTAISVFDAGPARRGESASAGQIAKLWGLREVRIGDAIGDPPRGPASQFAPPTLETVVVPAAAADKGRLQAALAQLAEQDPLINLRQDDVRGELLVSLYGEMQKEVVQATLADDFGIAAGFRETITICIERPAGTGAAAEQIGVPPNPFLAGVGLRVDPAAPGSGMAFRLGIELGSLPLPFLKATEATVRETLGQGLHGWQVTDCVVTLTESGYWPPQSRMHGTFDKSMSSTAGDFRNLTPLVLMSALAQAGTTVHEPLYAFRLEVPADTVGPLGQALARLRAAGWPAGQHGEACVLEGEIPAASTAALSRELPGLTRGEGVLETSFARYQLVRGPVPSRPRWDYDPLSRKDYLLRVQRGVR